MTTVYLSNTTIEWNNGTDSNKSSHKFTSAFVSLVFFLSDASKTWLFLADLKQTLNQTPVPHYEMSRIFVQFEQNCTLRTDRNKYGKGNSRFSQLFEHA
jgi:hypothetical protein